MWLFLSVLAVCTALCYVAKTLGEAAGDVARNLPYRPAFQFPSDLRFRLEMPRPLQAAEEATKIPTPSDEVLQFCAMESEPSAQQVVLNRAHQLYAQFGDWNAVLSKLREIYEPQPVEGATDGN